MLVLCESFCFQLTHWKLSQFEARYVLSTVELAASSFIRPESTWSPTPAKYLRALWFGQAFSGSWCEPSANTGNTLSFMSISEFSAGHDARPMPRQESSVEQSLKRWTWCWIEPWSYEAGSFPNIDLYLMPQKTCCVTYGFMWLSWQTNLPVDTIRIG